MRRIALLIGSAAGASCAGHFRTEHVGSGVAVVTPRVNAANLAHAPGVQLARGDYDLALRFDLPRAQEIEWHLDCGGVTTLGSLGESFDAYRKRRLAQLRAEREQQRQTAGAVTNLVVGAFAPTATVHAQGPNGSADVAVDPGAAAGTAVAASIDPNVELPPGDVGAGRVQTVVHVTTPADGTCSVTALADDANVIGSFDIARVRDLDAEARDREQHRVTIAMQARDTLSAQLVAYGADAGLRQRQRDEAARVRAAAEAKAGAEARARAELELRVHVEAQAHAEAELRVRERAQVAIEVRTRTVVLDARARLRVWLVACGADPELRARVRAEREAHDAELRAKVEIQWQAERAERDRREAIERAERERREAAAREQQARIDAELAAAEQARMRLAARRIEVAMTARAELRSYLVSIGARERPPMPALRPEAPGDAPFAGAAWIAGHWTWSGSEWDWVAGGWRDTSVSFGASGGAIAVDATPVEVVPVVPVVIDTRPVVVDHRSTIVVTPPVDHRSPPPHHDTPVVRDHRDAKSPDPKVRDHR